MSKKTSVAILFGGKSVEHEISINSARNINEYIDKERFSVILIGISPKGKWFLKETVDSNFEGNAELTYSLDPQKRGFVNKKTNETITPDIVFPVLHGTDGEDGSIQGMLTTMELPFVGTGVLGSAISMNKLYSKRLLKAAEIPVSPYVSFTSENRSNILFENIKNELGLPFMAKAANLGSSVGIYKVKAESDFDNAVDGVFKYDNTIIFEAFVEGRELECSVMGNEQPQASLPGEIIVGASHAFYTYEAKYLDPDAVDLKVPAEVDETIAQKIQQLSVEAYRALGCEDFARVDLFLKKDDSIMINEINTIPGFTNFSMFPMMWKNHGISFTELITKLIGMAIRRSDKNKNLVKTYKPV